MADAKETIDFVLEQSRMQHSPALLPKTSAAGPVSASRNGYHPDVTTTGFYTKTRGGRTGSGQGDLPAARASCLIYPECLVKPRLRPVIETDLRYSTGTAKAWMRQLLCSPACRDRANTHDRLQIQGSSRLPRQGADMWR